MEVASVSATFSEGYISIMLPLGYWCDREFNFKAANSYVKFVAKLFKQHVRPDRVTDDAIRFGLHQAHHHWVGVTWYKDKRSLAEYTRTTGHIVIIAEQLRRDGFVHIGWARNGRVGRLLERVQDGHPNQLVVVGWRAATRAQVEELRDILDEHRTCWSNDCFEYDERGVVRNNLRTFMGAPGSSRRNSDVHAAA